VAAACDVLAGRIHRIAGHLLQADPQSIVLADGVARSAGGETSIRGCGRRLVSAPDDLFIAG
jgi:aerobic carbon-monoxide dehydrogenase large subunit